jgi:parallel beta-helix repeat protein
VAYTFAGTIAGSGPPSGGSANQVVVDAEGDVWVCVASGAWVIGGSTQIQGPTFTSLASPAASGLAPSGDSSGAKDLANITGLLSLSGSATLQAGEFYLNGAIPLASGQKLQGAGPSSTTVVQTASNAHGVTMSAVSGNVSRPVISGMLLYGTGAGSGCGIYAAAPGNSNAIVSASFRDLIVSNWGSWGISADSLDFSEVDNVVATGNGQGTVSGGFNFTGVATGSAGCTMRNCYASSNKGRGYYLTDCNYWSLTGCSCDSNYLGYEISSTGVGGFGISLAGCGCEATVAGGSLDGTSFKVSGACTGVALTGCLSVNNGAVAFWSTGTSKHVTFLACTELTPAVGATASFKTDVSTSGYVIAPTYTTATSFSGTYTAVSDTLTLVRSANLVGVNSYGEVDVTEVGAGFAVAEGSNAKQGTATLNGTSSVVVSNTSVTASSRIFLTIQAPGGTVGSPYVYARSAGVSFTIRSTASGDTSTVAYEIFEPG